MSHPIPIGLLSPGERGIIVEYNGHECEVKRLQEMGLDIGAEVAMISRGTPCILRVGNQRLAFRTDDSLGILVTCKP